jgi:transcriptional regulator with PAS, ATPase and Fis domain
MFENGCGKFVGTSTKMKAVGELIRRFSRSGAPLLISGETGTGKELIARKVHEEGSWSRAPFVAVDCASLVPTLIETELFGHIRGSFTGAAYSREGLMESAQNGTLFLDEIAELPITSQSKLLRSIQEREFRPVGSSRTRPFRARIIAATNRDLAEEVRKRNFREDLFYRLNVLTINAPPLRERKTDIALLARHFLEVESAQRGDTECQWALTTEALEWLLEYDWPGNVRELENCMMRATVIATESILTVAELRNGTDGLPLHTSEQALSYSIDELKRDAIARALKKAGNNKNAAADLLGIGKATLYRHLRAVNGKKS